MDVRDSPETRNSNDVPTLINAKELAGILGVSQRTIWRLISTGKLIQPIRIGSNVRWRLGEITQWIDEGCPTKCGED